MSSRYYKSRATNRLGRDYSLPDPEPPDPPGMPSGSGGNGTVDNGSEDGLNEDALPGTDTGGDTTAGGGDLFGDLTSQTINIGGQEIPIIYLAGGAIALVILFMVMKK